MSREEAYKLVTDWTKNPNLIKHMIAVEAIMRALARHFEEDEELWGRAGLLHDADWEMFKDEPKKHPSKIFDELEARKEDARIINAIKAHAWGWRDHLPEPATKMEWSLFCCDDLSGFIIACALVQPSKNLTTVTVSSMQKKWKQTSFAAGAKREHAHLSEEKLGMSLEKLMEISLSAMQSAHKELGL